MSDTTKIKFCSCPHVFQDSEYGQQQRVHNWAPKLGSTGGWRCTVCGRETAK